MRKISTTWSVALFAVVTVASGVAAGSQLTRRDTGNMEILGSVEHPNRSPKQDRLDAGCPAENTSGFTFSCLDRAETSASARKAELVTVEYRDPQNGTSTLMRVPRALVAQR